MDEYGENKKHSLKGSFLYAKESPFLKPLAFFASAQAGRQMPGELKAP